MRPLELTVDGFRSYRTPQTFDLRGRRLVGIVGEIGAGKSSILDAIAFALYGKTPMIGRETKSLIHQLRDDCHVQLRFRVDGQVWQIQRSLRRRGQGGHKLVRLSADAPDADELELVEQDDPTKRRVAELLGMDFDAFCRSVLLAQNRFSEFLRAAPGERDKVLKGVFGLERIDAAHEIAKRRQSGLAERLAALAADGERLSTARRDLAPARERAAHAAERADMFASRAEEVAELREDGARALRDVEAATARAGELEGVAASVPDAPAIDACVRRATTEGERVALTLAELEAATDRRTASEESLAETAERVGDVSSFNELVIRHERAAEDAAAGDDELRAIERRLRTSETAAEKCRVALDRARATAEKAEAAVARAEGERERLQEAEVEAIRAESAHALRSHVAVGEPCPVCDRPIEKAPRRRAAPKTAAAKKAAAAAARAAKKARASLDAARIALGRCERQRAAADEALRSVEAAHAKASETAQARRAELADLKGALVERLGEGDPRVELEERRTRLADAQKAVEDARAAVDAAHEEAERVRAESADAADAVRAMATRIVGCWGRLGQERDPVTDPGQLTAARRELIERIEGLCTEVEEARSRASERAESCLERLSGIAEELDLDGIDAFGDARARADVERGAAQQLVADLEKLLADGEDLEERIAATRDRAGLLDRLERDLRPSRFLAFLLEEERAELAQLGSEHFERLTGGAFRFSEDDRFDVRDMNAAGRVRRADSLSGGETFLASLALALALAEMVARGGGRLDAFFLDEGFGSLDPEHLDLAMEGIGRLVARDPERLVVLVSHVREMRESIEDLIELAKDPVTGDTLVLGGAQVRPEGGAQPSLVPTA